MRDSGSGAAGERQFTRTAYGHRTIYTRTTQDPGVLRGLDWESSRHCWRVSGNQCCKTVRAQAREMDNEHGTAISRSNSFEGG